MINEKEYKTLIMQENYDSNNTPFCPEFTSIDTVTECMTVITEQTIYEQEGVEILSPSNLTQVYDEVDLLKSSNAYLLLPSKGQIKFSPNLVGEQILYKFKGKSSIYISDCRIWTTLNSNGNVIETLHDVIDDARKIIDFLKQTSDVVNLDVTLKTDIDNAKNITNIMENDIFSANQIDSNLKININSAKNEDLVLNSIIKKANESNDILTNTNNISIETNTNLNTLIQNANNSKSELDVSMKNVDVIKNDLNTLTQNANTTITKLETDLANGNTTQIRTDLDNVMSGQVNPNLIANGAFETWDSSDWGILGETTRKTLADEFTAPRGKMLRIDFIADSNGQGVYKGVKEVIPGRKYTWSIYLKANRNLQASVGHERNGCIIVDVTTEWKKITYTFTADDRQYWSFIIYGLESKSGDFICVHSLKIEEGGLATSYLSPMQPIIDSNLTTSNKYVIGAINELLAYIGTLSNLNTVNKTNLVNALNELNKAGKVEWFAMNSVPTGYLRCNGTAVSRTTYARLFSAIGTVFGTGDSSTTFNIPDLRGVVIRGYDDGRGLDVGRVFGSYQSDDFKSHCHTQSTGGNLTTVAPSGGSGIIGQSNSTETSYVGGVETRMKNVALLPCIRY